MIEDNTNPIIAGIIVHPSGWNLVYRNGQTIWLDVGFVWKAFRIQEHINGASWGGSVDWLTNDTAAWHWGFPIAAYTDDAGQKAVWDRVRQ